MASVCVTHSVNKDLTAHARQATELRRGDPRMKLQGAHCDPRTRSTYTCTVLTPYTVRGHGSLLRSSGATKQDRSTDVAVESTDNFFQKGAAHVSNLVNTLLFGAATRIERGTSVCVSCRGTGAVPCKECQATGVTKASATREMGSSLKSLVGTKSKEKEWIVSNRCRKCGGHGRRECPNCSGLGKRFVQPPADWYQ